MLVSRTLSTIAEGFAYGKELIYSLRIYSCLVIIIDGLPLKLKLALMLYI